MDEGISKKDAVKKVAQDRGVSKRDIYTIAVDMDNEVK
jgi:16S rRNA C1402 (ribose-2'-O) methylase RsmI